MVVLYSHHAERESSVCCNTKFFNLRGAKRQFKLPGATSTAVIATGVTGVSWFCIKISTALTFMSWI